MVSLSRGKYLCVKKVVKIVFCISNMKYPAPTPCCTSAKKEKCFKEVQSIKSWELLFQITRKRFVMLHQQIKRLQLLRLLKHLISDCGYRYIFFLFLSRFMKFYLISLDISNISEKNKKLCTKFDFHCT